eukprot:14782191-Alexandrium_andersonii.AAC.1
MLGGHGQPGVTSTRMWCLICLRPLAVWGSGAEQPRHDDLFIGQLASRVPSAKDCVDCGLA